MRILGIDPGPSECGVCWLDNGAPRYPGVHPTVSVQQMLRSMNTKPDLIVIERLETHGMPVGASTFETAYAIGRMQEILDQRGVAWELMSRSSVGNMLCHTVRASNSNIRQALIDRYGADKATAIGTKKQPGPLYGVHKHAWSALALAVTAADQRTGDFVDYNPIHVAP